jgi:hypothetical protein
MNETIDLAIIGAGPYALSLAAYCRSAGLAFRIFGKTMDAWKTHMPPGMVLKSHPWSSNILDPAASFTLKQFCDERGIWYHDSLMPLPIETFIEYGEAFQKRLVPDVERKLLVGLEPGERGFRAMFDDGTTVTAKRVVLAVGVHPFSYIPPGLAHLPSDLLTHSGDHGPLERFEGKEVAVVGAGASAIDTAALLHEKGASVSLIARAGELNFSSLPRTRRSLPKRLAYPLYRLLLYPTSGIGPGWFLKTCADAPWIVHQLPERSRLNIVRTTLGPLAGPTLKDRVVGQFPLRLGREISSAGVADGKVVLQLAASDGTRETLRADHVIAATGYRVDLNRLSFLEPRLRARIDTVDQAPELSMNYECSVPGLHFIGPVSANSFGPVVRFTYGAWHPSRRVSRYLAGTLPKPSISVSARE